MPYIVTQDNVDLETEAGAYIVKARGETLLEDQLSEMQRERLLSLGAIAEVPDDDAEVSELKARLAGEA